MTGTPGATCVSMCMRGFLGHPTQAQPYGLSLSKLQPRCDSRTPPNSGNPGRSKNYIGVSEKTTKHTCAAPKTLILFYFGNKKLLAAAYAFQAFAYAMSSLLLLLKPLTPASPSIIFSHTMHFKQTRSEGPRKKKHARCRPELGFQTGHPSKTRTNTGSEPGFARDILGKPMKTARQGLGCKAAPETESQNTYDPP